MDDSDRPAALGAKDITDARATTMLMADDRTRYLRLGDLWVGPDRTALTADELARVGVYYPDELLGVDEAILGEESEDGDVEDCPHCGSYLNDAGDSCLTCGWSS
jgi:hypothetical protein